MEYPGIFTAGTYSLLQHWPLKGIRMAEVVTVHEFGHEYWYGMVGSNEFEESWLDEGLTSYTEAAIMERIAPNGTYELPFGVGFPGFASFRMRQISSASRDAIVTPTWRYHTEASWGVNSYARPALALKQLEGELGSVTFARCLRAYFERFQYRHPDTEDFFATFEEVSGRDLGAFKKAMFYQTERFDLNVQSAASVLRGGKYVSDVTIQRGGKMAATADVEFRFANGHVERRLFPSTARAVSYRFAYGSALREVIIDPQQKNIWDANLLNNSKILQRKTLATPKLTTRMNSFVTQMLQLFWSVV
jgi:hypothetical protein